VAGKTIDDKKQQAEGKLTKQSGPVYETASDVEDAVRKASEAADED
jgi:uncharacterized protein YjbJ (UPF0337 family)